jgi:hypothetical protein
MSLKSKRQKFVGARSPLSDPDFAAGVGLQPERSNLAIAAREALGRICQIPASQIYPDDDPALLAELVWDWDDMAVILELEELLHIPLGQPGSDFPRFLYGRFFWRKWPGPKTVGEWAAQVADHVHSKHNANTTS